MYSIATAALVIAFMALLILGILRAARELLSRSIYETPLCQDQKTFERIEPESSHWRPGMSESAGERIRVCLPNSRDS